MPPTPERNPWREVVRSFRTYYDHFRIAFPHLNALPKYYSDDWANRFRTASREFVRREDMLSVRRVFDGVGYGTERWRAFAELSPDAMATAVDRALATGNAVADAEPDVIRGRAHSDEEETPAVPFRLTEAESVVAAIGEENWQRIVAEPERAVTAASEQPEAEMPADDAMDDEAVRGLQKERDALNEALGAANEENGTLKKALKAAETEMEDQARRLTALQKQLDATEEKLKEASARRGTTPTAREATALPPTRMAQEIEALENKLTAQHDRITTLTDEAELNAERLKETRHDLERERFMRAKFEEDLEEARSALREQMQRLRDLLQGEPELPTLDEFEEMSNEELLSYIEDVEVEKQRVMAGLDALDAQEQSYQRQIETQAEELSTIQSDLEQHRGSNLTMRVDEMQETMDKQRDQLQTLMSYSKTLKSRNEQLTERQEPLRRLVQKLNLQEKAIVRYVRMRYDNGFMPEDAYLRPSL